MNDQRLIPGPGAIVTACSILEAIGSNAKLESFLLEYGLNYKVESQGSISKTMLGLKAFAADWPDYAVQTEFGKKPVALLIVEEAINRIGWSAQNSALWEKLERYLNLEGYALLKDEEVDWAGDRVIKIKGLVIALPEFAELPAASNEVDTLLSKFEFEIAIRHLSSAKENIARGDWEAANGQCRAFLEALTNAISICLYPEESAQANSALQNRQLLANRGFLSREKCEFGDGNGHSFLPGLAKLLHSDGAHPGISTQNDSMFRLQLVIVTARWLLKRLETKKGSTS